MAYVNYKMKLERQAREDTLFYKIFNQLIEIDPDFVSGKSEMEKHFVITQIHDDLHHIYNDDHFEKEITKAQIALEEEKCQQAMPISNMLAKIKSKGASSGIENYTINKRYKLIK